MKRLLKIIVGLLGAIVTLLIIAAIVVSLFFDPNDYREQIAEQVQKQTGRTLTINGEIELAFFPWIGIELGEMSLANAKGFGSEPFARFERAEVRVKLMPLLSKRVEMDRVVLHGLNLNLARAKGGSRNWDDLITAQQASAKQPSPPAASPSVTPSEALAGLAIGGIEIIGARLVWDDAQSGQRSAIEALDLTIGAFSLDSPFSLDLGFDVDNREPQVKGRITLKSLVQLDLAGERYLLDGMELTTRLATGLVPGGRLDVDLNADIAAELRSQTTTITSLSLGLLGSRLEGELFAERILGEPAAKGRLTLSLSDPQRLLTALKGIAPASLTAADLKGTQLRFGYGVDLASQTLTLSALQLAALGIELQGQLTGSQIIDGMHLNGTLSSNEFVPRDLTRALGIVLPAMADPSTLSRASLALGFSAGLDAAAVDQLQLKFDDSTLSGSAAVTGFAKPALRYQLTLDQIDADRYLPPAAAEGTLPATKTPVTTPATGAAAASTQLPNETLRALDIDGTARIGKLKVMNLRTTDIHATLLAKGGVIRLHPLGAKLYQGSYDGDMRLDVRKQTPQIAINERLAGVQAGPLLKDFMGKPYVSGKAQLTAKMTMQGIDPAQVRRTLNGNAAFRFDNGAVDGINIAQLIRNAMAAFNKQPAAKDAVEKTDFAELSGSLTITNGLVRNNDLSAKSPLLRITGKGEANLVTEQVDYLVTSAIVGTLTGEGGKELSELKGLAIPIRVQGSFADPKFKVELDKLLEAKAKQAIKKEQQKLEDKARKGIEKKLGDDLKQLFKF